jgi:glycine/sarcosine N-methyltransferase
MMAVIIAAMANPTENAPRFDLMSEAYDAMINWEKRLARETPLYRRVFEQVNASRVLDAACGTGRHVALFASWGLEAEGADLSPEMIQWCRRQYANLPKVTWEVRSFTEAPAKQFDAVICTGNSLALLRDEAEVAVAIRAMGQAVRSGGALVLQVVQVAGPGGPVTWDKCKRLRLSAGECLLLKGIHTCGSFGYVDFILTPLAGGEQDVITRSIRFLGLKPQWLTEQLKANGFARVELFGGYGGDEFEENISPDILVVAYKG